MEYETLEAIIAWSSFILSLVGFAILEINWNYVGRLVKKWISL